MLLDLLRAFRNACYRRIRSGYDPCVSGRALRIYGLSAAVFWPNLVLCEYPCDKNCFPKLLELSLEVEHGLFLQATGARLPAQDSSCGPFCGRAGQIDRQCEGHAKPPHLVDLHKYCRSRLRRARAQQAPRIDAIVAAHKKSIRQPHKI